MANWLISSWTRFRRVWSGIIFYPVIWTSCFRSGMKVFFFNGFLFRRWILFILIHLFLLILNRILFLILLFKSLFWIRNKTSLLSILGIFFIWIFFKIIIKILRSFLILLSILLQGLFLLWLLLIWPSNRFLFFWSFIKGLSFLIRNTVIFGILLHFIDLLILFIFMFALYCYFTLNVIP